MNDRKRGLKFSGLGLQMLIELVLVVPAWLSAPTPMAAQGNADIAVFTKENGQPAYDACYVLVNFSEAGCDDNGDGKVMFADVPYGTYTVRQTADLGPGRYVDDFIIAVTGNINSSGFQGFSATIVNTQGASSWSGSSGQTSNIAIVTTENTYPVYDACYVLVDFSNTGCDDNGDGKITFWDVPLGTYTVQQVADLGFGRSVPDFEIGVVGSPDSSGFERFFATVITSSGSAPATSGSSGFGSSTTGAVDISLITREPTYGNLLYDACYQLLNYSNIGCDDNGDGQVTFTAIPPGTYTVRQTQTPAGYPTINDFDIVVGNPYGVPLGFVVKQAPNQNAPNTRNVSVVFIDMATHEKLVGGACAQLVGVSLLGCDDDVPDGQIDFLDVPAGGPYELSFSNLPDDSTIGEVGGPLAVSIDAGSNAPSHQFVFVLVAMPGTASSGGDVASTQPPTVGDAAETVVEADGFSLTLEGISVSGGSDVAAAGTSVHAQLIEAELPADVSTFAMAAGRGVEITLGDSIQPAEPLAITFAPDIVESWGATSDSGGDLYPVVFCSRTVR